jgi:hypothetical protein
MEPWDRRHGRFSREVAVERDGKQPRYNLPPALLHHHLDRIRSREISADQLGLFAEWLDMEPEVPSENGSSASEK